MKIRPYTEIIFRSEGDLNTINYGYNVLGYSKL